MEQEEVEEETDVMFEHNCGGTEQGHRRRIWPRGRLHEQQCFGGTRGTKWCTKVAEGRNRNGGEWKHKNDKWRVPVCGLRYVRLVALRRMQK